MGDEVSYSPGGNRQRCARPGVCVGEARTDARAGGAEAVDGRGQDAHIPQDAERWSRVSSRPPRQRPPEGNRRRDPRRRMMKSRRGPRVAAAGCGCAEAVDGRSGDRMPQFGRRGHGWLPASPPPRRRAAARRMRVGLSARRAVRRSRMGNDSGSTPADPPAWSSSWGEAPRQLRGAARRGQSRDVDAARLYRDRRRCVQTASLHESADDGQNARAGQGCKGTAKGQDIDNSGASTGASAGPNGNIADQLPAVIQGKGKNGTQGHAKNRSFPLRSNGHKNIQVNMGRVGLVTMGREIGGYCGVSDDWPRSVSGRPQVGESGAGEVH
jgi:hypothetical protein